MWLNRSKFHQFCQIIDCVTLFATYYYHLQYYLANYITFQKFGVSKLLCFRKTSLMLTKAAFIWLKIQ